MQGLDADCVKLEEYGGLAAAPVAGTACPVACVAAGSSCTLAGTSVSGLLLVGAELSGTVGAGLAAAEPARTAAGRAEVPLVTLASAYIVSVEARRTSYACCGRRLD